MRSLRLFGTCVVLIGLLLSLAAAAQGATSTERFATGFSRSIAAASPPGDTTRLFVAEQHTGEIEVFDLATGNSLGEFLDLGGLATGNEQGLLGFAFDPNYATNGFFYVNINTSADGGDTHIRRYKVQGNPATSNVADASSAEDILVFNQPQTNHNGGWIGFSPNDPLNLYISTGDGGGSDDNDGGHTSGTGNAQDVTDNLLGKMLRINPSREEVITVPYTIPEDNPILSRSGPDEIWAYGLRNPFRASFDRQTGDLWIGDVGQNVREEIDFQPADSEGGENYGWRLREGSIATPSGGVGGPLPPGAVDPVYEYLHNGGGFGGFATIGGYVYRGPVAEFQGHYIFADNVIDNIWKLDPDAVDIAASVTRINNQLTPDVGTISSIGSFAEDGFGNLYIVEVDPSGAEDVFKIVSSAQDAVWDGDSAVGTPGDGSSWSDDNNWTRGGVADDGFVTDDNVIFAAGSSEMNVNLQADRTAAAVTFQAPYTLQNNELQVLSGNVTVDAGVTATIESDLVAESANHSIRKLGDGTLLVEGNTGQTAVKAGTLGGNGTLDHLTVKDGGTVAPGASAGTLHVDNSFTLEEGSRLEIELGGTEAGEFDRVEIGGTASLAGGTIEVSLIDGFVPEAGDSFAVLSADGGFDNFAETILPDLEPGLSWFVNPGGITLFLNVEIGLPGDYNLNGVVDAADYAFWLAALGQTVDIAGTSADGNADGVVDAHDYALWRDNFNNVAEPPVGSSIPEPSAIRLFVLAAGIVSVGIRHRLGKRSPVGQ